MQQSNSGLLTSSVSADARVADIHPSGTTLAFAAPEVLHALAVDGKTGEKACKVNGPAADMWSAGCVLYAMLTGNYPFDMDSSDYVITQKWGKYIVAQDQQKLWVSQLTCSSCPIV